MDARAHEYGKNAQKEKEDEWVFSGSATEAEIITTTRGGKQTGPLARELW